MIVLNFDDQPFPEGMAPGTIYITVDVPEGEDRETGRQTYHVERWDGRGLTSCDTFAESPFGDAAAEAISYARSIEGDGLRTYRVTTIRRYERSFDIRASSEDQAEMLALESPDEGYIHKEMLSDEVTNVEEV